MTVRVELQRNVLKGSSASQWAVLDPARSMQPPCSLHFLSKWPDAPGPAAAPIRHLCWGLHVASACRQMAGVCIHPMPGCVLVVNAAAVLARPPRVQLGAFGPAAACIFPWIYVGGLLAPSPAVSQRAVCAVTCMAPMHGARRQRECMRTHACMCWLCVLLLCWPGSQMAAASGLFTRSWCPRRQTGLSSATILMSATTSSPSGT